MSASSPAGGAEPPDQAESAPRGIALWLLLFVLLFGATEGMVRIGTALLGIRLDSSYGYPSDLFVDDPELGFALRPGFVGTFPNPPYDEIEIHVNQDGYRDGPFAERPGAPRLLVVGDSITFGAGVRAEERFTDRLGAQLCQAGRCEVLNAGVNNYQAENYLAQLRELLPRLSPDQVLVGFCMNDIRPKATLEDLGQATRRGFWNRIRGILSHSQLLRIGARIGRAFTVDAEAYEQRWIRLAIDAWSDPAQRERLAGTLREMQSLAGSHGAGLAFVLFPERHQLLDPAEYGLPYAEAEELIGALGLPVVSLMPRLESAIAAGELPADEVFLPGDNIHFTPRAHAWIAAELAEALGPRLWDGSAAPGRS